MIENCTVRAVNRRASTWVGALSAKVCALVLTCSVALADAPARVCGWTTDPATAPVRIIPDTLPEALNTGPALPGLVGLRRWLAPVKGEDAPPPPQFCGGTAVAPNAVLTARHCVEGRSWIRLDVTAPAPNGLRFMREATTALCPVLSVPGRLHRDMALILLKEPLPSEIPFAGLVTEAQMNRLSGEDELMLASWPLAMLSAREVEARRTRLRAEGMGPYDMLVTRRLAGHRRGPCGGESGSPVYAEVGGSWALFAVLSAISRPEPVNQDRTDRCADPETRALLTPTVGFRAWIDETLRHCAERPEACAAPAIAANVAGQDE